MKKNKKNFTALLEETKLALSLHRDSETAQANKNRQTEW